MIRLLADVFLISCIHGGSSKTRPTLQINVLLVLEVWVESSRPTGAGTDAQIDGGLSKTRPTLRLEEEHHFFVEVFPDAV